MFIKFSYHYHMDIYIYIYIRKDNPKHNRARETQSRAAVAAK